MAVTTRRTATGVSVTISLTQEQIDLIGSAAGTMADQLDTALWALARLRSGEETTAEEWCLVVNDLGHQLLPRLTGIYDEATRAAVREGVSHGQLARAMDVSRSTAQTR
ncbi:hypothetical protein, partial [Embleya sp. NPDC005575]|uniref:hypothetical protein n=1 Tax=Embleya sp. NPDC005575 TaxID=3156892 RepID=UPI0033ACF1B2